MSMTLEIPTKCVFTDAYVKTAIRSPDCKTLKCLYDLHTVIQAHKFDCLVCKSPISVDKVYYDSDLTYYLNFFCHEKSDRIFISKAMRWSTAKKELEPLAPSEPFQ